MKKIIALAVVLLSVAWAANAEIVRPFAQASTNEVPWWLARRGVVAFELVDHNGKKHLARRNTNDTEPAKVGSVSSTIAATVAPDNTVLTYTVTGANFSEGWSIDNVAPATYDLVNGTWYTDMTDAEKTALWVAYTNKVIQAEKDLEAYDKRPAEFDVSRSPEEYKKYLLGDRVEEDLAPTEKAELNQEYYKYKSEWTRINDPENYRSTTRIRLPDRGIKTSEMNKSRAGRFRFQKAPRESNTNL